jgi:hypothetical protein
VHQGVGAAQMRRQVLLGDVGAHEPGLRRHPVRWPSRDTHDLGDGGIGAERINYRRAEIPVAPVTTTRTLAASSSDSRGVGSPLPGGRLA